MTSKEGQENSYQENRSMEYFEYALRQEDMILFNKVLDERQKE
jgi:hypothetical protein